MTQKEARKIMLWKAIERYRTAGGREEHHAYKEALDNYIDDMLDISEMDEVAHRFAHILALELECVLANRPGYYDKAMRVLGEYRSAMNAIHEQHSPTHMGEPLLHNWSNIEKRDAAQAAYWIEQEECAVQPVIDENSAA